MKKKNLILIIIVAIFLITGCYSKQDIENAKKYKKQGKINAINYIKEKYNFNPEVVSVTAKDECSPVWESFDCHPNGDVEVTLTYKGKSFNVYVTGRTESTDATDNYQFDIIKNDAITFFRENISLDLYNYDLFFNESGIKELYDGNDAFKYVSSVRLYYIGDNNLNEVNIENIQKLLSNYDIYVYLMNFESKEKYSAYKNIFDSMEENKKNIYKESMLTLYKDEKTFFKKDYITNYNNEVYVYSPRDENKYEISITNIDDLSYYKSFNLDNKELTLITNVYSISSTNSLLYIYFPLEKDVRKMDIRFITECNYNGEKKREIDSSFSYTYDYYIIDTYNLCDDNSTLTFALIKATEKDNSTSQ